MWDESTVARARSRLDDVAQQLSKELGFKVALRMPPAKFNPRLVGISTALASQFDMQQARPV
jgi:hypothetical protein